MIKVLLHSVCLVVLGMCIAMPAVAAEEKEAVANSHIARRIKSFAPEKKKTYSKVVGKGKAMTFNKANQSYKVLLQDTISLHNMMNSVQTQIRKLEDFRLVVLDKEISKERVKDFDECNEKWLSDYFANPGNVWSKLKKETQDRVLAYDLNMAVSTEEIAEDDAAFVAGVDEQEQTGSETDEINLTFNANDLMKDGPEVAISFAVLNLFYPDQDAWGQRKTGQTSSLPLWNDQKYLYDRDVWKPKYQKIVEFCLGQGHKMPLKEPKIDDAVKYDYYLYDQVKSAHDKFIKTTEAQGCLLSPAMKNPPKSAPRPLPPVYEEIIVFKDGNNQLGSIYPQTPMNPSAEKKGAFEEGTLWEKYKADKYRNINEKGEFSTYFNVSKNNTITTLPPVDNIDGNRLSRYLLYKRDEQTATEAYESFLDDAANLKANIEQTAATIGIEIPSDINYLNKKDLNRLLDALKKGKENILKIVKQQVDTTESIKEAVSETSDKSLASQGKTIGNKMDGENVREYATALVDMKSTKNKKELDKKQRASDTEIACINALDKDKKAELLITEESALTYDESIKRARADQELTDLLNEASNKDKLADIKAKNFRADLNKTCLGKTKKNLLNINKVKIE